MEEVHFVNNEQIIIYKRFVDLVQCDITRNNDIM